jgi:hypothetical protein
MTGSRTPSEQVHTIRDFRSLAAFTNRPRSAGGARLSASFRGRGRLPVSGKATILTGLELLIVCARGGVILYSPVLGPAPSAGRKSRNMEAPKTLASRRLLGKAPTLSKCQRPHYQSPQRRLRIPPCYRGRLRPCASRSTVAFVGPSIRGVRSITIYDGLSGSPATLWERGGSK